MTVSPTEGTTGGLFGVTAGSPTTQTSSSTSSSASSDKDMFLQLLVAQMRYQDPMNPTDSAQFLAQSAQFTALEKMELVADQTGKLLGAQLAFGASALVGRSVGYTLDDGTTGTGTVGGVTFGADGPVLDVAGADVPLASVVSVNATDPDAAPSGATA